MSNDCKHIDDFYQCLNASKKYEPIISQKTTGLFNGTRSSYTVPTTSGFVKVKCDNGYNTAKFSMLDIMILGSMKGNTNGGIITSEGLSFMAKSISAVDESGKCEIVSITSNATLHLPMPASVQNK